MMDKNQNSCMSYEDDKSDSVNRSANDKLIEFPTSGNSAQFKIDSGIVNTLITNRNSHYKNVFNNQEDRGTIKVQIFLNIEFDFNGKIEMLKFNDELPPTHMTIESVITTVISEFNYQLEKRNSRIRINPNESIWNLYMSKKNGKPKQDLPALDRDNLLSDTQVDMFTLDTKNPDKLWDSEDDKWIDYKLKQDDDDEDDDNNYGNHNAVGNGGAPNGNNGQNNDSNHNGHSKNNHSDNKSTFNENKQTQINQEIPTASATSKIPGYNSKVAKQKKPVKDNTSTCSGLCGPSKKY